jgi:hypothetical protein
LQRAALGRDRAFAVLDAAAPGGRTMGFHWAGLGAEFASSLALSIAFSSLCAE